MALEDTKEEIRRRLDIIEVVSQYVPLRRQGRRYAARCPFHQEKTPSFFVDPERGYWKCFGCGAAGDIFSFVMQIEGLSFPEAAERLAQRAGVAWRPSPGAQRLGQERKAILEVNAAAAHWFRHKLFSPEGQVARAYLHQRGVTEEMMREFMLGYAPNSWDSLFQYLKSKGYSASLLSKAGLIKPRPSGEGYYDVFRHRVIFPIQDVTGQVIAFGGRALDPEDPAKYINSPDTPVFKKGATVYGLPRARPAIAQSGEAIVVEGYMDVIALAQAGFANVVACLGTATTEEHLKLLSRYAEHIIFVYDADAPGMRAALRNIALFESTEASVRLALLPPGQDPDECVRSAQGPQVFAQCLQEALSFPEYEIKMAFERHDMSHPDGRLRAVKEAVTTLLKVRDRTRREELLDRVAARWAQGNLQRTEQLSRVLRTELRRRYAELPGRSPARARYDRGQITEALLQAAGEVERGAYVLEEALLVSALHNLSRAQALMSRVCVEDFVVPQHREIAERLFAYIQSLADPKAYVPADLIETFEAPATRERAIELLVSATEWTEEEFAEGLAKMEVRRAACGLRPKLEVSLSDQESEELPRAPGEDFETWRKRVAEAIDRGELTPDHPDFVKYITLGRRFQGTGGRGFSQLAGIRSWSSGPRRNPSPSEEKNSKTATGEEPQETAETSDSD